MTNLFITILNWVQSFVGSYGWSVIVFTLLIKLVLLPLDVKSRRSMKAMSALNPKLEELKKRYANDQQKLNMKTQELYKKSGVNPLSGCLPMLIQLPILYIMFAAMRRVAAQLQVDIMYAWLKDAGVALSTFCVSEPRVPLKISESTNLFNCGKLPVENRKGLFFRKD